MRAAVLNIVLMFFISCSGHMAPDGVYGVIRVGSSGSVNSSCPPRAETC